MDNRISRKENEHYQDVIDSINEFDVNEDQLPYWKNNVKQYRKKKLSEKQKAALKKGRDVLKEKRERYAPLKPKRKRD
ncbi:hypothetical protein TRFO_34360 [Tritrichomonas foetus]|uniref:Uncharacterized protein n=1 Tax=Tritrichomonas foetus TaxID=1144522 RepID=A0A1J4JLB0_9EUKA|nr:hypothetical protein TRFO_34360 [Tritrichomonas foetus]|eukprot:OHS99199.1 hypothetical protein TRFO_34360 [Tritrichomonas foetus]